MRDNKANSNKYIRIDTIAGKRIVKVNELLGGKKIFLPDVGWTENNYSNYVPDIYRTQKEIQQFFEQKLIIQDYLIIGFPVISNTDDKLKTYYGRRRLREVLSDDEIEEWKTVWLYEKIVKNDSRSVNQKREDVAKKLKLFEQNQYGISEYQRQLPDMILTHDFDLYELVNICSQLSIEQLYILGW